MQTPLLIVMLKAPRPGLAKTRLATELGVNAATAAYRELLNCLLPALASLKWPVQLRFTPDDAALELAAWRQPDWQVAPQGPGDLGERLDRAVTAGFGAGFNQIVVIGADCPYLEPPDLQAAAIVLEDHDLVLGPAEDGGYWLIGLRKAIPQIFEDIAWSTSLVLGQTLDRASLLGLSHQLLRSLPDVDTAADWQRFEQSRKAGRPNPDNGNDCGTHRDGAHAQDRRIR